jgi:putative oxidoreductase
MSFNHSIYKIKFMKITVLAGRLLFSLIFFFSGFNLFSAGAIGYAASEGVPLASLFVPISGILAIAGSVSIILGYKTRIGAVLLAIFLVPVTLAFHHFWTVADPGARQNEMIQFMKNTSMLGGVLILFVHGAGPYSLDARGNANPGGLQPEYANKR